MTFLPFWRNTGWSVNHDKGDFVSHFAAADPGIPSAGYVKEVHMELLPIVEVFLMLAGFICLFAMSRAAAKEDKRFWEILSMEDTDNDG